jgi:ADP-ribosylglycohydrolase
MMGAIIGDIVGSVYEWHNIKTKDFPLFRDDCSFTDDTGTVVSVIAVVVFATIQEAAKALVETLQKVFSPIRTQANDFLTACKYYYSTRHIVLEEHDGPEEFAALAAPEEPEDLPS